MDESKKLYNTFNSLDQSDCKNRFDSKEEDEEKKRNKRRSKNDSEGRNHKCPTCGKSYLSYPALYTHIKQKHNINGHSGRGRGRPKKDTGEPNLEKVKYNPLDISYFAKDDKKGRTDSFEEAVESVFVSIYGNSQEIRQRNRLKKIKEYDTFLQHPFLRRMFGQKPILNSQLDPESSKSNEIFADYLLKMSNHCNPEYFMKLLKFITLFREFVNITNIDKANQAGKGEYTEIFNSEDVPDVSNEFITEFLDPEQGQFDFTKEEAIDLTQNFCNWLYQNNYTCSKLSLISNYINS